MNPLFSFLLKQLPHVLPVVESVLKKAAASKQSDGKLDGIERSLALLAERSDYLEMKLKRITLFAIVSMFLSLTILIVVLIRH